jgi:hypothetical protein
VFGQGGIHIFDLSTGTPAYLGGKLYDLDAAYAVQLTGTYALLGMADSLRTIDVSNPANLAETGSLALPTSALALSGSTLFDGTKDGRLVVLNVANPSVPSRVASVSLPAAATNLRLAGNDLFVADGQSGLLIFDVSNPAAPTLLSQFTLATPVWDVAPSGNVAFLAADTAGLVIVDISNLQQPRQISQTTLETHDPFAYGTGSPRSIALSVALQGGIVYVGTANSSGLVFGFDCSQTSNPRLVLMSPFGESGDSLVSGFAFLGTDIYVIGSLDDSDASFVQSDNTVPRNVIDLYYPPVALRSGFTASNGTSKKRSSFQHPKLDRNFLKNRRQHNGITEPRPSTVWSLIH